MSAKENVLLIPLNPPAAGRFVVEPNNKNRGKKIEFVPTTNDEL